MQHKLWYNQVQGFAYMQIVKDLTSDDINLLFGEVDDVLAGRPSQHLIIDLRLSAHLSPSKQLRDTLKRRVRQSGVDRIAVIGVNPVTRMTFKVLLAALGKSQVSKFCDTEKEAMAWLRNSS